jgi:spoIIIJ-associated protein
MQSIEITAKSLDEAKKQAAAQLGVAADQVTVTVIEETKGLFGKSNVRVRAEVAAAPAEKPARGGRAKAAPKDEKEEEKPAKAAKAAPAPEPEPEEEAAPVKETKPKGRGKKQEAAPAPAAASEGEDAPATIEATKEDAERMLGMLRNLADATGLELTVSGGETNGRYVNLSIGGDDAGYLVGKNGEVLNSLQYLLTIIYNQQVGNGVRATLEGNDYRRKREEQLTILANKIAAQVEKRGEEAVLDALPAFERRIVHKALGEHPSVMTYSEGEEPNRRVVIAPRD